MDNQTTRNEGPGNPKESTGANSEKQLSMPPKAPAPNNASLVHELQTYQVELESQNEDMRSVQAELIESRNQYSELYEFAPLGYVSLTDRGVILRANTTFCRLVAVSRESVLTRHLASFVHVDDADKLYLCLKALFRKRSRQICSLRLRRADGEQIHVRVESVLAQHGDTAPLEALVSISDETEFKAFEEEQLAMERRFLHTQKLESLGVLAGGIAHDFNNILTSILGNAGLALISLSPDDPARTNIGEIEIASKRAADLCKQMLAYSGRGAFNIVPVDLSQIVEEMMVLLQVSIPKQTVFNLDLAASLPAIKGDPTQIRQVVMNLISNAAESIEKGLGTVSISTSIRRSEQISLSEEDQILILPDQTYVHLKVTDTGCGMDAKTVSKIFEPFFSTKFTGRGLGLSAVQGIMREHKGAIRVQSQSGMGTTVRLYFPVLDEPVQPKIAEPLRDESYELNGTILVVDDEEAIRTVVERTLLRVGCQVLCANDGVEALEVLAKNQGAIDLVLLDLTMPRMGGPETLRRIQEIQKDIPVVLSSGFCEKEAMGHVTHLALAGFIQKPYQPEVLLAVLREALAP
ncbi:MAG: PAS domain S-box-containing protein [Planctomycetota bacterium]|jgi:PAS domain S-box-containing protein